MSKTDAALAGDLDRLRAKGVRFIVCRNTLKGMGLLPADLHGVQGADIVPCGVAELARLRGQCYVYIHPYSDRRALRMAWPLGQFLKFARRIIVRDVQILGSDPRS